MTDSVERLVSTAITRRPEIAVGQVTSCPICAGELEADMVQAVVVRRAVATEAPPGVDPTQWNDGGVSRQAQDVGAIVCQGCGWTTQLDRESKLVGDHPELAKLGLPEICTLVRSHRFCWWLQRRTGHRLDFRCAALVNLKNGSKNQPCPGKFHIWIGPHQGWSDPRKKGTHGETRNPVLGLLSHYPSGLSVSEVAKLTGLSRSRVEGFVTRAIKAKYPYVERSREPVPRALGVAHTYKLTQRGVMFVQWGLEIGIYEAED